MDRGEVGMDEAAEEEGEDGEREGWWWWLRRPHRGRCRCLVKERLREGEAGEPRVDGGDGGGEQRTGEGGSW